MNRSGPISPYRAAALMAFLLASLWPVAASAHGVRLPFDRWGGFSTDTVRCQRVIARAAAQCASSAWAVRRACQRAELAGEICDHDAADRAIQSIRNKALDAIDNYCREHDFIQLQYLGLFDLQADVINFCRDSETALVSAVYGPVQGSTPSASTRACVEAAGDAADGILQFMLRNRRQCMDHIASMPLSAPNRAGVLDAAARRTSPAQAAAASQLIKRCAPGQFKTVYGRSPSAFVDGVSVRADCVGAQFYIQDAVLCPAAVCGNGIIEPGEDCDDGNTADGDSCPSTCQN